MHIFRKIEHVEERPSTNRALTGEKLEEEAMAMARMMVNAGDTWLEEVAKYLSGLEARGVDKDEQNALVDIAVRRYKKLKARPAS